MTRADYPDDSLQRLDAVTGKRARIVVEHILEHGYITTEDLQQTYGYEHPPRAVRDVREQGIPIATYRVTNSEGKSIAAYRFGEPEEVRDGKLRGRSVIPKSVKEALVQEHGAVCALCLRHTDERFLQVDHRVPFEVAGDQVNGDWPPRDFMLVCRECNRAKSWSCEHCPNQLEDQRVWVCKNCYWASPEGYAHIALTETRRLAVVWNGNEVEAYERLRERADASEQPMPEYVKRVIDRHLRNSNRLQ
ncbi:MAG: HNH endonuclease [Armatimonadota bacterium]|nr:HNH endonuclease [Armatimonadota bacterium]